MRKSETSEEMTKKNKQAEAIKAKDKVNDLQEHKQEDPSVPSQGTVNNR